MRKGRSSNQKIIDLVRASPAARVKVAVTDIDGVLRGKYIHKEKFLSAVDAGFGFCNVVFGWDMGDQCYDNATWTGWHTGFPDALAKINLDTYRRVPWDDNVPFFLADFVDGKDQPSPVCPRQLLKKVLARIYVHESIHVDFVDAFVATVRGFKIGDPRDDTTYIGPLTRKAQLAVLKRQVADARKKGASLLLGGKPLTRKGHYFAPTVLSDVDHRMELMREESFGPVIGIQKVKDDFEAVRLMNGYGLRPHRRRLYTRPLPRRENSSAHKIRLGILELLRPSEPAPAVVGAQAFGHRAHFVDLRHTDFPAPEGVAFARRVTVRLSRRNV